jgi:hypothetical protein
MESNPKGRRAAAPKLSVEQLALVRHVTGHRTYIDGIDRNDSRDVTACEVEHSTLLAVGWALALLGHGPEVIGNVRRLLGAEETP